jgi:hypothetical protein
LLTFVVDEIASTVGLEQGRGGQSQEFPNGARPALQKIFSLEVCRGRQFRSQDLA